MEYFKFGTKIALAFFLVGTAILVLFYINPSVKIALIAYQFTIVAIVINWLYAAIVLFYFLKRKLNVMHLVKTLGVMAINVPIGILYSYIMVWLLTYARITFSNSSGSDLAIVAVSGCEGRQIKNLKTNSSETIWIKIHKDCSIEISYEINGSVIRETVAKHLIPTEGIRTKYEIGSRE